MKKYLSIVTSALLALCLCVLFVPTTARAEEPGKSAYRVTFFDNYPGGGETIQKVAAGEKAAAVAAPERAGYSFDGWYDSYAGGNPVDLNAAVSSNLNIFAHWTKTANVVIFKMNGEGVNKPLLVADGEKIEKPADPTSDRYTFLGWFADGAYTKPFDFDQVITAPTNVYAGWSKSSALLTFNLNYTGAPEPITVNASLGNAITLPEGLTTERALYRFDGWYLKSFPGENDKPVDLAAGIEEDATLYAKWTRTHYLVEFNPNQRDMESVKVEVPVENPVAAVPEIRRDGYEADEVWYEDAALTRPVDLKNITDDITVYAKWNIQAYSVAFDLNGAEGEAPAAQEVEFGGKAARPENPAWEGHTFLGWFTEKEEGSAFNFDNDTVPADMTLYAHWASAEGMGGNVKVTFNYNAKSLGLGGASGVYQEVEIPMGSALGDKMVADPALNSSLMFMGWYTDETCKTPFDPASIMMADTTVYARILVANVFEAEYVNLAGKQGVGSSVELPEEAMIFDYTKIGAGNGDGDDWVSGDFYVAGMYYKGAYIEFEINASKELTDAVLELRVSSEFKELKFNPLTPETYRIDINPIGGVDGTVNDSTNFLYELPLTLPLPNTLMENDPDGEKTPFENVIVSYHFHLNEGDNVIRFTTNNSYNYGAGTFQANAPMLDCITIYADSNVILRMNEYYEFIDKKEIPE